MPSPLAPINRSLAVIRRWLRYTWLSRLPLVNDLLGIAPVESASTKKKRTRIPLEIEILETRCVANDAMALGTTALAGGIVAEMAATYRTPTQVLMHGWGTNQPGLASQEPFEQKALVPPTLSAGDADRFFLSLVVTPPPEPEPEPLPENKEPGEASEESPESKPFVSATAALGDPLLDADFLDNALSALGDPLADGSMDTPKETGGGGGGGEPLEPFSGSLGGDSGATAAPDTSPSSGGSGGGGGGSLLSDSDSPQSLVGGDLLAQTQAAHSTLSAASSMAANAGSFTPVPTTIPVGGNSQTPQQNSGSAPGTPIEPIEDSPPTPVPPQTLDSHFGNLPLAFEANRGQANADAQFLSRGQGYSIFLTSDEAVLRLSSPRPGESSPENESQSSGDPKMDRGVLRVQFVGARDDAVLFGKDELISRSNYLRRGDALALTDIPNFSQVVAQDVYDGVDIVYQGASHDLRFDFVVEARADYERIGLRYVGAESVTVDEQGRLVLEMAGGTVVQDAPILYQQVGGDRQAVVGSYVQRQDGSIGFTVEDYDRDEELVIDPTIILGTYFGGSSTDVINGVAADSLSNVYLVGSTNSGDFPTEDPYDDEQVGTEAFVSKLSADGTSLLFSTYLGGESTDVGYAIAVDDSYNIYVTGETESNDFITTDGAYDETFNGRSNVFVTKLASAGDSLVWSTLLGATGSNSGRAIAVDTENEVYVGGTAQVDFPTDNGLFTSFGGFTDGFVTKLNSSGSEIVWSTYLGGTWGDELLGLALDSEERVYVTGYTQSGNFPTENAYDSTYNSNRDAFVTRIAADGETLDFSTFLGTDNTDGATAIAVDSLNRAVVVGYTAHSFFPTTAGAWDTTFNGASFDAFVTRFEEDGSDLSFSTYLGGGFSDEAYAVAVDSQDNVYVAGLTWSPDFPLLEADQTAFAGYGDAFVTRISESGAGLEYSTYLGGSDEDYALGLALDADDNVLVVGGTRSTDFPTGDPILGANAGDLDGFVTRFNNLLPPRLVSITDDTGTSDTDFVTSDPTLSLTGVSRANSTVTIYLAGVGQVGTTTADGDGDWSFNYSGTTLVQGTHAFTFTASAGGYTGPVSRAYLVTVDQSAPLVTLTAPSTTYDLTPQVMVVATDAEGMPATGTVTLDVDLNNDNDFLDAGETGYAAGAMVTGLAILEIAPALSLGTVKVRARVADLAGNEGISNTTTLTLQSSGSSWTTTDVTALVDPGQGNDLLQRGNLNLQHALDLDISPGYDSGVRAALVYNSERTSVQPIVQATIQTDNSVALSTTITVHLSLDGTAQSSRSISTAGRTPGELITVAEMWNTPLTTSGSHDYLMTITMDYGSPITRTVSGSLYAIVEDDSPLGAGWTLGGWGRLVDVPGGKLLELGWGGYRFYEDGVSTDYVSRPGDNATLSYATGGGVTTYYYDVPDGQQWTFDENGYLVKWVSPDQNVDIDLLYDGSYNLTQIQTADGAYSDFTYSSGLLRTIDTYAPMSGARTVTLTHTGTDLTGIENPDGGLRSLTYDGDHQLTRDEFGGKKTDYAYNSGVLIGQLVGDPEPTDYDPAILAGLASLSADSVPSLVDGAGRKTRVVLDTAGRVLEEIGADGGITRYTRDGNGWVTGIDDPLGRHTTIVRDAAGYATSVTNPDGTSQAWQYQSAFHALTRYTDEDGKLWTFTYDVDGHRTSVEDPFGNRTTMTYNGTSGLLETVEDALGRVTTYLYDTARQLETTIDPAGSRTTLTYDGNGNVETSTDALGRVTTYTNDVFGRVTRVDAPGGLTATYTYNALGQKTSSTEPGVGRTDYEYNESARLARIVEAVGTGQQRSRIWSYNDAGEAVRYRDANGNIHETTYDAQGRVFEETDALGNVRRQRYDLAGQPIAQRDELGRVTGDDYDNRGRVTRQVDALGNVTTIVYDERGNLSGTIDALGVRTSFVYDELGRQTAMIEAVGTGLERTTTSVYDVLGNVVERIDALGRSTEYEHDALNRVTTITEAVGTSAERTMTLAYDAVGNEVSRTDWRGVRTDTEYDDLNRVTTLTEAVGTGDERTTTYAYNAQSQMDSMTDPRGFRTTFAYDSLGREVSRTEGIGGDATRTTRTLFDAEGRVSGTVDALGKVWRTAYDQLGRPTHFIDPLGNTSRTLFNADGSLSASIDALGNRTDYGNDALGRVVRVTDALGNVSTTVYDAVGHQTVSIDALGRRTTATYDALSRVVEVKDALGNVATSIYDNADNLTAQIDPRGNRTTFSYDALDRVIEVKDALNGLATTLYDDGSNVLTSVDPLGNRTSFVYDALSRTIEARDAEGFRTTMVYDDLDNAVAVIDSLGRRTTAVYDSLNRAVQVEDALNQLATTVYDAASRVIATVDALGRRTTFSYDAADRLVAVEDALNQLATTVYDAAGNVRVDIDALGRRTTATYDALNRRTAVQDALGNRATTVYDAVSNASTQVDALGNRTSFVYDALDRVIAVEDALNHRATTMFDSAGNVSAVVDPRGNRTSFVYDALNRQTQVEDALGRLSTTVYDAASNVLAQVDALNRRTTFTLDKNNRTVQVENALNHLSTVVYDAVGNTIASIDELGRRTTAIYDALNRVIQVEDALNHLATTVYDAVGNTVALVDALERRTTFTFDALDRQTEVQDALGGISTSVYDAVGNQTVSINALNRRTTATYDALNRTVAVEDALNGVATTVYDAASNILASINARGNRTTYTHDALNRVETVKDALNNVSTVVYDETGNQTVSIDALGRRTTATYDALNRAVAVKDALDGVATTVYDEVGNVKASVDPLGRRTTWSYDALDRVIEVKDALGNLSTAVYNARNVIASVDPLGHRTSFVYDALDRQIAVEDALGLRTTAVYDAVGNQLASVDALDRRTTATYDSLNRVIEVEDALNHRSTTVYDAVSNVRAVVDALDRRTTFTYDALNRQIEVQDALGNLFTSVYDAVGNQVAAIDALGRITTATYDVLDRVVEVRDALNGVATTVYDGVSNVLASVDPLGNRTSYVYDALNRQVAVEDALNHFATTVYDSAGNVLAVVDQRGNRTSFTYDALNRNVQVEDALGKLSTTVYDALNVQATVDPRGNRTSFVYDVLNREVAVQDALGRRSTVVYDEVGNQTVAVDALGRRTTATYDAANRLVQTEDALNHLATTVYDAVGNAIAIVDALDRRTTFTFDALDRQTEVQDALGGIFTSVYDAVGNQTVAVDALDRRTTFTFDALNRPVQVEDALNHLSTTVYDAASNVLATINARGHATSFTYDALHRVEAVKDALGNVSTVVYDEAGNQTVAIDALGRRTTATYDALNRVSAVEDALHGVATTVYDEAGNVKAAVDPLGRRTTWSYDALNRAVQIEDARNGLATTVFDEVGNVRAAVDQNGNRTTLSYDALDRRETVEDALNQLTTVAYDAVGNVESMTNARGYTTTFSYDALNRQIQTEDALNQLSSVVYDAVGNTRAVVDARGNRTSMVYDALNRVIEVQDASGNRTTSVYDEVGNRTVVIDAQNNRTTMAYDALDRVQSVKDAGGGVATTVYDEVGNAVRSIDPVGNVTTFVYDKLNRLEETRDAEGGITTSVYDAVGNRLNLIDPVGNVTTFVYDELRRVIEEIDPLGESATFAYDAVGLLESKTDRLDRRRDFEYDKLNRVEREVWLDDLGNPVNTITFDYDENSNRISAADQNGAYTYTFDELDRLRVQKGPFGLTLTYTLDEVGNVKRLDDSKGGVTTSTYNAVNLLTHREFTGNGATLSFDQAYDSRNALTTITRFSDLGTSKIGETLQSFDEVGRAKNIHHKDGVGASLQNTTYTYDLASRLKTETIDGATKTFTYDQTDQLTGDGTDSFDYDLAGNRDMAGYVPGPGNQMLNDGTFTYTYDEQGNREKKSKGAGDETWTYGYDHRDQMIWMEKRATDGGTLQFRLEYVYDYAGRLIAESRWTSPTGTVTQHFGFDGLETWAELDGGNGLVKRYVRPDGRDALAASVTVAGVVGWYATDRLDSVRLNLDNTGAVVNRLTYNSFGKPTASNPTAWDDWGYTSKRYERTSGTQLNHLRVYDPETSLWLTEDPSEGSGYNPYRYLDNNPFEGTDPDGLMLATKNEQDARAMQAWLAGEGGPFATALGPSPGIQVNVQRFGRDGRWALIPNDYAAVDAALEKYAKKESEISTLGASYLRMLRSTNGNLWEFSFNANKGTVNVEESRFRVDEAEDHPASRRLIEAIRQFPESEFPYLSRELILKNLTGILSPSELSALSRAQQEQDFSDVLNLLTLIPEVRSSLEKYVDKRKEEYEQSARANGVMPEQMMDLAPWLYGKDKDLIRPGLVVENGQLEFGFVPTAKGRQLQLAQALLMRGTGNPETGYYFRRSNDPIFPTADMGKEWFSLFGRKDPKQFYSGTSAPGLQSDPFFDDLMIGMATGGVGPLLKRGTSMAVGKILKGGIVSVGISGLIHEVDRNTKGGGTKIILGLLAIAMARRPVGALMSSQIAKTVGGKIQSFTSPLASRLGTLKDGIVNAAIKRPINSLASVEAVKSLGAKLHGFVSPLLPKINAAKDGIVKFGRFALDVIGQRSCFVAGTPLLTPTGSQRIELLRQGDLVLARSEHDPEGAVEAKTVENVFVRVGLTLELYVNGRMIRVTNEHPFFVVGRGWVSASLLCSGDLLISHNGELIPVERVVETREVMTVYNVEVREYHTYFVGCDEWGFSVWAHNAEAYIAREIPPHHPAYTKEKPFGIWDTQNKRFTGETFESLPIADLRAADLSTLAAQARSVVTPPTKGKVQIEKAALDQAKKSSDELAKLRKLQATSENLADGGFDVRVLGEGTDQVGDLAVKGPGLARELPAQSKQLESATKNSVQANIDKGVDQVAKSGTEGVVVIDGKAAGLSEDIFNEGLGAYLRSQPATGKSGTVIVVFGDGSVVVRKY